MDPDGRSAQRLVQALRLVRDAVDHSAGVRGQDIHAVPAPIVTDASPRLLARATTVDAAHGRWPSIRTGCWARGEALQVFGDALIFADSSVRTMAPAAAPADTETIMMLNDRAASIYAGANEVRRNQVAAHLLAGR